MKTIHLIINRLIESIGRKSATTVFTSSFSAEDQLLTYAILESKLPIQLATIDTGRLFPEVYELWSLTELKYQLAFKTAFPSQSSIQALVNQQGINGFYSSVENRKSCCYTRKVEPLQQLIAEKTHWIAGLRNEQSENRNSIPLSEWDSSNELIKVNPLYDFRWEEVLELCKEKGIPINPMHENGYPSIGCQPCTRKIEAHEHPRAGRWWWELGNQECGLHESNKKRVS